jgi:uncharacterized membrane protein
LRRRAWLCGPFFGREWVGGGGEAGEGALPLVFGFFGLVFLPLVLEVLGKVFVFVFMFSWRGMEYRISSYNVGGAFKATY